MLAETETLPQERHPPLEIFCPFCQPDLRYHMLFPQTAERKMKQALYSSGDGSITAIYSCEGCLEMYFEQKNGLWEVRPMQDGTREIKLPDEYQQYLKRTFGNFKLVDERV